MTSENGKNQRKQETVNVELKRVWLKANIKNNE